MDLQNQGRWGNQVIQFTSVDGSLNRNMCGCFELKIASFRFYGEIGTKGPLDVDGTSVVTFDQV